MSELKAFNMPRYAGQFTLHEVYIKSEADKVIAELNDKLRAANEQIENLINSASNIMLFQDKVNNDKCAELRHHKYKRCLAMEKEWRSYAAFCGIQSSWHNNRGFGKTAEKWTWKECHAWRCVKRWLELVKKANALCKEAK